MKKYTCYDTENGNPETHTKKEWCDWWEQNGNKEDYADFETWFFDCIRYHLLIEEK